MVLQSLFDRIVDRHPMDLFTILARCHTGNNSCSIIQHQSRVKNAFIPRDPLYEHSRLFVYQY